MPRPQPAAPSNSFPASTKPQLSIVRPPGSVTREPVLHPATKTSNSPERFSSTAQIPTSDSQLGSRHWVYHSLQRNKTLMGCELEPAKLIIMAACLCFLLAVASLNLGWLIVSVLLGGPFMLTIRMLSDEDTDCLKVYFEALAIPHIREPEGV